MRIVRSWLFVPGHRDDMVAKAMRGDADAVVFDLEDSVPPGEKDAARDVVADAVRRGEGGPLRFVRISGVNRAALRVDLPAAVGRSVAGLVLPKVESRRPLAYLDATLKHEEPLADLSPGSLPIVPIIESAAGMLAAPQIARHPRVAALILGAEDLALDLGAPASDGPGLLPARFQMLLAAASCRVQAIDRAFTDVRDGKGLLADTRAARELGYTGKACIHPNQIETVHDVFTPTPKEIEHARDVVAAYEEAASAGQGAVLVAGKMVDAPIVERARRLLELHAALSR